jgi:hypothetical protein
MKFSGFRCRVSGIKGAKFSYEPTSKWHGFLMIKLAALAAGDRAEQRTAEYRISNRRMSKGGIALLSLF